MTAPTTCRDCGAEPRAGARFCDACGAPIVQSQPAAEYKQVTVLFADVVRSMDIAAAVGPERLREIMAELLRCVCRRGEALWRLGEPVHRRRLHGGVRCASHVGGSCFPCLPDCTGHSDGDAPPLPRGERRDGITLQLRIGLNSGQVIAGEVGSSNSGLYDDRRARRHGPTDGIGGASGGVMLSESTARLVENAADIGEPELVQIKGRLNPCKPRSCWESASIGHGSATSRPSWVGRLGTQHDHRNPRRGNRRCRMCSRCARAAGYRQEPTGPRSRDGRSGPRRRGDRDVLRVACRDIPFHVVSRLLRAGLHINDLDAEAARAGFATSSPMPIPKTYCFSTICWASATTRCRCPTSLPMRGAGG